MSPYPDRGTGNFPWCQLVGGGASDNIGPGNTPMPNADIGVSIVVLKCCNETLVGVGQCLVPVR